MAKHYTLTNGTELFFVERGQSNDDVTKICAVSFSPGNAQREKIDITTLCETAIRQTVDGLKGEGECSFTVIFTHDDANQKKLIQAANSGKIFEFRIGSSGSKDAPTYENGSDTWTLPRTRGWWKFTGEIAGVDWSEFAVNGVVQATIRINLREDFEVVYQ